MLATASILILTSIVFGQVSDVSKPDETEVVRILEPYFQGQAASYEFFLDAAHTRKAQLVEKPVMRWTAEGNLGAVWVWTLHGRVEVIGCLGAYVNAAGKYEAFHEFHSATLKPLQKVEISNVRTWESQKPGVELRPLDSAPEPSASDKLRLVQMRTIAREFEVELNPGTKKTHQLRLATAPLFRYQSDNPDLIDGAIFSYLQDNGTDPECLLMVEARKASDGIQWYYAPLRFTWRPLRLTHRSQVVWQVAEHNEFWKSRILRDQYVTCSLGVLNLDSIRGTQKENP
ncbi:MAG: hypothetical protein JSS49_22270 [Planctomycetes bacterium]|nr:hypothetical protein [Planctomycetota bacterium]